MFKIIRNWRVSGITTDAAKASGPFWTLGGVLRGHQNIEDSCSVDPAINTPEMLLVSIATEYAAMQEVFEDYFLAKNKSQFDAAVEFLVMFSAVSYGVDNREFVWQGVRHLSQGLYGSMQDCPEEFKKFNIPLIREIELEVDELVSKIAQN